MVEADALGHLASGFHIEVSQGLDMESLHGFWMLLGDLLDLGAAIGRRQHIEVSRRSINGNGDIILVQNVLAFGDKHAVDLVIVNGHRQNLFRCQNRLVAGLGKLDATRLTTMTDFDLSLNDIRIAEFLRGFRYFVRVLRIDAFRSGDALLLKQLTRLVFV